MKYLKKNNRNPDHTQREEKEIQHEPRVKEQPYWTLVGSSKGKKTMQKENIILGYNNSFEVLRN